MSDADTRKHFEEVVQRIETGYESEGYREKACPPQAVFDALLEAHKRGQGDVAELVKAATEVTQAYFRPSDEVERRMDALREALKPFEG